MTCGVVARTIQMMAPPTSRASLEGRIDSRLPLAHTCNKPGLSQEPKAYVRAAAGYGMHVRLPAFTHSPLPAFTVVCLHPSVTVSARSSRLLEASRVKRLYGQTSRLFVSNVSSSNQRTLHARTHAVLTNLECSCHMMDECAGVNPSVAASTRASRVGVLQCLERVRDRTASTPGLPM